MGIPTDEDAESLKIPLAFAWRIWIALVDAAIHLRNANLVHLDLHVGNFFFSTDDVDTMGGWGFRPQAADFGCSMPITSFRFDNPSDFDIGASRLWTPEQEPTVPPLFDPPNDKINGKTSVFQIAIVMGSLLNNGSLTRPDIEGQSSEELDDENEAPFWPTLYTPEPVGEQKLIFRALFKDHTFHFPSYMTFTSLLSRCLRFSPSGRLSSEELRAALILEKDKCDALETPDPDFIAKKLRKGCEDERIGQKRRTPPGGEKGPPQKRDKTGQMESLDPIAGVPG